VAVGVQSCIARGTFAYGVGRFLVNQWCARYADGAMSGRAEHPSRRQEQTQLMHSQALVTKRARAASSAARKRNPEETRRRILDAAETLFAAKGFTGTRVQSIVDRARVNKRMLYHYFGSKRGIYAAVAELRFREILDPTYEQGRHALETAGPQEALRTVIGVYFDALCAHPRYTKFVGWEAVAGWPVLNELEPGALTKLHDLIIQIFRTGIESGVFDANIDPEVLWSQLVTLAAFYFHFLPRAQLYTDRNLSSAEELALAKQSMIRLILRGVEKRQADSHQCRPAAAQDPAEESEQ
jgi:TetR/AcrR family transcriptional regulator